MTKYTGSFNFPDYKRDIRRQLLKRLNYHSKSKYAIKKIRSGKDVQAIVYYTLHGKIYRLGHFTIIEPERIGSGLIKREYNYLDSLTTLQIESAQNKLSRKFQEVRFMQENDLL